jgi:hypothetical protein
MLWHRSQAYPQDLHVLRRMTLIVAKDRAQSIAETCEKCYFNIQSMSVLRQDLSALCSASAIFVPGSIMAAVERCQWTHGTPCISGTASQQSSVISHEWGSPEPCWCNPALARQYTKLRLCKSSGSSRISEFSNDFVNNDHSSPYNRRLEHMYENKICEIIKTRICGRECMGPNHIIYLFIYLNKTIVINIRCSSLP